MSKEHFFELRVLCQEIRIAMGRTDLNPRGKAATLTQLLEEFPTSQLGAQKRRIAEKLGKAIILRNTLAEKNRKLVFLVERRMYQTVLDSADLAQAGYLGLLHAVETYDPTTYQFSTWAAIHIRQRMQVAVKKSDVSKRRTSFKANNKAAAFYAQHGRMPEAAEIGERKYDLEHLQVHRHFVSTEEVRGAGRRNGAGNDPDNMKRTVGDTLPSDEPGADEQLMVRDDLEERSSDVAAAIATLCPEDRAIVRRYLNNPAAVGTTKKNLERVFDLIRLEVL
jgi:RNA polymerase sigma factor (sigma-70 family)